MDNNLLRFDKTSSFLFVDFETFNLCLSFAHNRFWQCGMLNVVNGKIIEEDNIFIKDWDCGLEIGAEAARITKYNPYVVEKQGIYPSHAWKIISEKLDKADYIVGHNTLNFDLYLIKDFYKMFGRDYRRLMPKMIDTNALAKAVKLGINYDKSKHASLLDFQYPLVHHVQKGLKTNLTALAKEYELNFDPEMMHDATYDLKVNIDVWDRLKFSLDI